MWFLGSSTTYGEGQRDGYTIASQVARLAEAARLPVRVRNFGQRGWVHFQEMLLYEQLLADEPTPAFSVFIDGANEVAAQAIADEDVPTHLLAPDYATRLAGVGTGAEGPIDAPDGPNAALRVWRAYRSESLTASVVGWISGAPAGAEPDDAFGLEENGRSALAVYERGRALTLALSRDHKVVPLFVWQPFEIDVASLRYVRQHLSAPTVDIADALDGHEEDFIDPIHTNESGARRVAQAIWRELRPQVEQWYAER